MKKNIFLFVLLAIGTYAFNLDAMQKQDGYDAEKITTDVDGWTIIESPLNGTGAKAYIKGDENSQDVIFNVERSLASTDYFLMRCLNIAVDMVSNCSPRCEYEVDFYHLVVMLALAGETPYKWETSDAGFITSAWWINYVSLDHKENIIKICLDNFKKKFSNCKHIKLQCDSLYQEVVLRNSDDMHALIEFMDDNVLKIVLDGEKVD
ncbi:MAG: hypothetical protein Q8L85_05770 [Alphaproteobacteria bacterium]|nr:hypothetical protein [Alphaproteobacteria bacterium]